MGIVAQGVPQIAITVKEVAAAKRFFVETLGFQELFEAPAMAMLRCGETRILLGTAEPGRPAQGMYLYFRVPDIQAACKELGRRGVKIDQPPHKVGSFAGNDVWLAVFRDNEDRIQHFISETPTPK